MTREEEGRGGKRRMYERRLEEGRGGRHGTSRCEKRME